MYEKTWWCHLHVVDPPGGEGFDVVVVRYVNLMFEIIAQ